VGAESSIGYKNFIKEEGGGRRRQRGSEHRPRERKNKSGTKPVFGRICVNLSRERHEIILEGTSMEKTELCKGLTWIVE